MSGFERSEGGGAWTTEQAGGFPADFSQDEMAFARELAELFAPEREELPPMYTQTLLEDERLMAVPPGFEQKLIYRVFRQLRLARAPLFPRHWHGMLVGTARNVLPRVSRPLMAGLSAAAACMAFTIILASPAFAAGLQYLLAHSGAQTVRSYPDHVSASGTMTPTHKGGYEGAPTHIDWFGPSLGDYQFSQVMMSVPQRWSDGPVVELRYTRAGETTGNGILDVREFRPSHDLARVLQVVEDGAANSVQVGDQPGVYIDGQWINYTKHPSWQFGVKGELIFEQDGMIFWIVADQLDGMKQEQLVDAALNLTPVALTRLTSVPPSMRMIAEQLVGSLEDPAAGEVLALIPIGSSVDSSSVSFVSLTSGYPDTPSAMR
jgi:hypothetical protein